MLDTLSDKFYLLATGSRLIILFIANALMMGYIMPLASRLMSLAANNSVTPFDLMYFYYPEKAFEMMDKYGEAGRAIYLKIELTADIVYPIIYTLFYVLLISWLFQRAFRSDSRMQNLNLMPVSVLFFDVLENVGIVSMIAMYPSKPEVVAWLTMIFGSLKGACFLVVIVLVQIGFVKAATNRFRKHA